MLETDFTSMDYEMTEYDGLDKVLQEWIRFSYQTDWQVIIQVSGLLHW